MEVRLTPQHLLLAIDRSRITLFRGVPSDLWLHVADIDPRKNGANNETSNAIRLLVERTREKDRHEII